MRSILLFLLTTSTALAAGGGDHGPQSFGDASFSIVAHAVNLTLLLGLIVWAAGPAIRDALANRSTNTRRELEDAAQAKQDAQARYEELEARLSDFEKELAQLRSEAEANVQREVDAIHARGERDARLVAESARRSIADEVARARQTLRRDAVDLAVQVAGETIKSNIGDEDQQRLGREFLGAVGAQEEVTHG